MADFSQVPAVRAIVPRSVIGLDGSGKLHNLQAISDLNTLQKLLASRQADSPLTVAVSLGAPGQAGLVGRLPAPTYEIRLGALDQHMASAIVIEQR